MFQPGKQENHHCKSIALNKDPSLILECIMGQPTAFQETRRWSLASSKARWKVRSRFCKQSISSEARISYKLPTTVLQPAYLQLTELEERP